MSTVIKLDTNALRFLIDLDPEFKLEVQRAVLQNIVNDVRKDFVTTELQTKIKEIVKETNQEFVDTVVKDEAMRKLLDTTLKNLTQSIRSGYNSYSNTRALSSEVKIMINRLVEDLVKKEVNEKIGDVPKIAEKARDAIQNDVDARLNRIVDRLENSWKEAALHQIQKDVASRVNNAFKESAAAID